MVDVSPLPISSPPHAASGRRGALFGGLPKVQSLGDEEAGSGWKAGLWSPYRRLANAGGVAAGRGLQRRGADAEGSVEAAAGGLTE